MASQNAKGRPREAAIGGRNRTSESAIGKSGLSWSVTVYITIYLIHRFDTMIIRPLIVDINLHKSDLRQLEPKKIIQHIDPTHPSSNHDGQSLIPPSTSHVSANAVIYRCRVVASSTFNDLAATRRGSRSAGRAK